MSLEERCNDGMLLFVLFVDYENFHWDLMKEVDRWQIYFLVELVFPWNIHVIIHLIFVVDERQKTRSPSRIHNERRTQQIATQRSAQSVRKKRRKVKPCDGFYWLLFESIKSKVQMSLCTEMFNSMNLRNKSNLEKE